MKAMDFLTVLKNGLIHNFFVSAFFGIRVVFRPPWNRANCVVKYDTICVFDESNHLAGQNYRFRPIGILFGEGVLL